MIRHFVRNFSKFQFQYKDPFQFSNQLSEEERLVQHSAYEFSKKELQPIVTSSFRQEIFISKKWETTHTKIFVC